MNLTAKELLRNFQTLESNTGFVDDIIEIIGDHNPELQDRQIMLIESALYDFRRRVNKFFIENPQAKNYTAADNLFLGNFPLELCTITSFIMSKK